MDPILGKIIIYRVFDIGPDVNLEIIQKRFLSEKNPQRFRLHKNSRAMIINNAPLTLNIEGGKYDLFNHKLEYEMAAKIWHFGAISISLQLTIPPDLTWDQLIHLASFIEGDLSLHQFAIQHCTQIIDEMDTTRLKSMNWETYEDYTLFFFRKLPGVNENALSIFTH